MIAYQTNANKLSMIKEPNIWAGSEKGFFEIIDVLKSKLNNYEK